VTLNGPAPGRIEDHRLLTGRGRYVADLQPPGCLHAVLVRADRAPAAVLRVDAAAARAMPGVALVWTGADLTARSVPPLPQESLPQDEGGRFDRPLPLLCDALVRCVGEPLALIVADGLPAALDAAGAVGFDLAPKDDPPVTTFVKAVGDAVAVRAALAGARHVVSERIVVPRVTAMCLEPRGCLAEVQPDGRLHLTASSQNPAALRAPLARVLGLAPDRVRVSAGDVGGSFGLKGFLLREEALVALAALHLGRPVQWIATRCESLLADPQGRGLGGVVTLGLDADLRIVALQADLEIDAGAYVSTKSMGIVNNVGGIAGVYDIPVAHVRIAGRTSARPPLAPYRGHGRPEATLCIELTLDRAARVLGVDAADLRRRNLIARADLPAVNALGFRLDSGDFAGVLDRALAVSGGSQARRAEAVARGQLFGRAVILCVEAAGGPVRAPKPDHAEVTLRPDGRVVLRPGVMSVGQGHETVLTRLVAAQLGVDAGRVDYLQGDTDALDNGRGSGGSSGLVVCGPAVVAACDAVVKQALALAAAAWGCRAHTLVAADGLIRQPSSNRSLTLAEVAALAGAGGVTARESFTPPGATFPNGAHVAEVAIDPDTGAVEVTGYWAVEDAGTLLNPALVEGQMMGGIAQGLSEVLGEAIAYDVGNQLISGSLMDYMVPRAGDLPPPRLFHHPVPTALNPLGAKGVGEAGTVGSVAALMCAVRDALAGAGVADFDMPATPDRVWRALHGARTGGGG